MITKNDVKKINEALELISIKEEKSISSLIGNFKSVAKYRGHLYMSISTYRIQVFEVLGRIHDIVLAYTMFHDYSIKKTANEVRLILKYNHKENNSLCVITIKGVS